MKPVEVTDEYFEKAAPARERRAVAEEILCGAGSSARSTLPYARSSACETGCASRSPGSLNGAFLLGMAYWSNEKHRHIGRNGLADTISATRSF